MPAKQTPRDCLTILRAMRLLLGDEHRYAESLDRTIVVLTAWVAPEEQWQKAQDWVDRFGPPETLTLREAAALSLFANVDLLRGRVLEVRCIHGGGFPCLQCKANAPSQGAIRDRFLAACIDTEATVKHAR